MLDMVILDMPDLPDTMELMLMFLLDPAPVLTLLPRDLMPLPRDMSDTDTMVTILESVKPMLSTDMADMVIMVMPDMVISVMPDMVDMLDMVVLDMPDLPDTMELMLMFPSDPAPVLT